MGKRMFSADIVESDAFLDMPLTAQALYMHLNMYADNDGFVNPKRILRMVGGNDDDLKILIAKRFLLVFPTGIVVIKHWWINNTKRLDRHVPTTYQNELGELAIKPNKSYTEKAPQLALETEVNDSLVTKRQPSGNQMAPEAMFNRSYVHVHDQVHVQDKPTNNNGADAPDDGEKSVHKKPDPEIDEMFKVWADIVGLEIKTGREKNRRACSNLLRSYGKDKLTQLIHGVAKSLDDRYAPRISDFASLQTKLNDLLIWGRKKGIVNGQRAVDLTN